jgi:hypothetical protein
MESLSDLITRLRLELSQARATRDRIEKTGESSSFGGIAFTSVAYTAILKRIAQIERQLFNLEAARDNNPARSNQALTKVSQY